MSSNIKSQAPPLRDQFSSNLHASYEMTLLHNEFQNFIAIVQAGSDKKNTVKHESIDHSSLFPH